ncbi:endolytic transglycosylase MltG [Aliiglaciecola sp. SL4]|uniref:endolytic transglycosylase MltG n=1 Tax=Aliiglaciecola sp. SL4 TaxID=3239806 RepID=UPI00355C1DEF
MSRWLKFLLGSIVFCFAVMIVMVYQINTAFNNPLNIVGSQILVVKKGQYAHSVINKLYERSIIKHPVLVKAALKLEPELSQIKAGTYELSLGMSARNMFNKLSRGIEKTYQISLIEGLRWQDWLIQLNNHPHLVKSSKSNEQWLEMLDPDLPGQSIEGWLLADTYHFTSGTKVEDIVKTAHQALTSYLSEAWQTKQANLPYESPYEALIMASIVEKETGVPIERPRIAAVFVNRLNRGMRLQTDPTVIYGMGEAFDGNIRRKDLRQATPYNTYVIKRLPPTPIAMPSKLSIDAVLHPLYTEEFYFVSKGDGTHYFSETLQQHNRAVRQYQLKKSKSN